MHFSSALALASPPATRHLVFAVETTTACEFVDVTAHVAAAVAALGLRHGVVTIQTRHTTTGILINEREPLLLADLTALFARLAPSDACYAHDDFDRRLPSVPPGERRNGHAHCRAALLRTSECVGVADGELTLGRWQRVMLAEFDGPQRREIAVVLCGEFRGS
jgi:secondary thiamine-phosphate synthase enzyme